MDAADGAVIGVVGTVITGIIGAFGAAVIKVMSAKHSNSESTQKRTLDEAFRLIEVKNTEIVEHRKEIHELRNKLQELTNHKNKCEIDLALAVERQENTQERVELLENILREHGYNIPVITVSHGSKTHQSLPSSNPPEG